MFSHSQCFGVQGLFLQNIHLFSIIQFFFHETSPSTVQKIYLSHLPNKVPFIILYIGLRGVASIYIWLVLPSCPLDFQRL